MSDLQIGATIDLREAFTLLDAEQVLATDLTRVFQGPIDARTTRFFERQFATRGSAGGTPWPAISPLTQKLRSRSGHGHEGPTVPMRDTNVLWSSYTKAGGPDGIRVIDPQHYARGSAVPYASSHQEPRLVTSLFGRPLRNPKAVPARPVVPEILPDDYLLGVEQDVATHLETGGK